MFDKLLFQPLFNTGQTIRLHTADGVMLDACDANIGVLKGKARTIPAILCDGADESENWQILNIVDGSGLFLDHVAVKGAVSNDQAQRLCQKYLREAQRGQFGSQVELTHNGVKTFLDSANTPSGALSLLAVDAPLLDSQGTINTVQWDDEGNLLSHDGRLSQMMLDMAGCDIQGDLLEQVGPRDVVAMLLGHDGEVISRGMFDAMIIKYNQFEKTTQKIAEALKAHDSEDFFVKTVTPIEPFKRQGVVNVGVIFEMSDSQTITVLFNNPDTTPAKLTGTDILTSWKWILNKRDVTAILQPRAVDSRKYPQLATRMIRVLAKNHDRFKRAQMARSKEELLLEELVGQVESAQSQLRTMQQQGIDIQNEIDAETVRKQQQTDAIAAKQAEEFHESLKNALAAEEIKDPTQSTDYTKIMDDQAQLEAWQDALDSFLQSRMIETRNALRGLGWDGEKFKNLSKYDHTLVMDLKQVGGGGNIVGVTYSIPTTEFTYRDDFSLSPDALAYRIDQALPEPEVVPKTTDEKKAEYRQILDELKGWVPAGQLGALAENIDSEDFESFYDQVTTLQDIIKNMPAVGSTDGQGKNAIAILHYFSGGSNWYVTEADSPSDAFGYASLNGFDYEAGYMQISDIIKHAELDLNFNQASVHDLIRDNANTDKRSKAEKLVDAAYKFDDATDLFKEFVSDSINDDDYSPFLSAKTIDEAAKANGFSVSWGYATVDGGEIKKDGAIVGRADIGGDGKSMIFVGAEGDTRVGASEGENFMYTEDLTEQQRMVDALVRATGSSEKTPSVSGDEFGETDLPELRKAVQQALEKLVGEKFACPALNADVEVRTKGIKKLISMSADIRKLQAIAALKELLENATKTEEQKPYMPKKERNIKAYHILQSALQLNDQLLNVRFVIREDDKGHYHYDHSIEAAVVKNAKSPLLDGLLTATFPMAGVSQDELAGLIRLAGCELEDSIEINQNNVNSMLDSIAESGTVLNMFIVTEEQNNNEQNVQMNNTEEQFLNDVIAGSVDMLADETGDRLEQIAENLDPSLEGLFAQAIDAYTQAALGNASSLKN